MESVKVILTIKCIELGSRIEREHQFPVKISAFNYKVKSEELEVSIKRKNGTVESLPLRILSDGIKSTMSMIADIAYRMAILNPQLLDNILQETSGIVLIDEIDMHLKIS